MSCVSAQACSQAARTVTPELERAGSESKSSRTPVNTRTLLPSTLRNAYRFPIRLRSSPMSGRASASKPSRCSHRIAAVCTSATARLHLVRIHDSQIETALSRPVLQTVRPWRASLRLVASARPEQLTDTAQSAQKEFPATHHAVFRQWLSPVPR